MQSSNHSTDSYQAIGELLAGLRQQIRNYILLEAVLLALVLLGTVFWTGLLLDWIFEPSPIIRLAVHVVVGLSVAGVLIWWGLRRWLVPLPDRSLALLVERKHPELADALSAAVDLHAVGLDSAAVHPELARRTLQSAAQLVPSIEPDGLLNQLRLNRLALLVGGLAIPVILLAVSLPGVWYTYAERIALSTDRWPRSVDLAIDGFEPDGQGGYVRKVARNSDVPLVVRASLENGLTAPDRVSIRYNWREGRRGRDDLVRIGDAVPGRDTNQRYEYLFERIASDVEFEIRGGDDRLERLRLVVVERPKVTQLTFDCTYPAYLDRANRQIAVGPRIELPEGTRIVVRGEANKPLEQVRWRKVVEVDESATRSESTSAEFETSLELAASDVELEVELLDADGIVSADPFRVTIATRRDQKPQVVTTRQGVGTAVTANARLPIEVAIDDDHAVNTASITVVRDNAALPDMPVALPPAARRDVVTLATVDLGELARANADDPRFAFAPGQTLSLVAHADDKYNLTSEPRTTASRALAFEIVTEEELMSRLASAEQNLRQTFESVADKLLLLYESLEKLDDQMASGTAGLAAEEDLLVADTTEVPDAASVADHTSRQAGRLAETARQIGDEVLGVAAGFEDIHAQLFNNRVENSELSDRISNRIAAPLRELGEQRMPTVATQIAEIATAASTTADARRETQAAIAQVEQLLREMQGLENYNEVIAMLRDIIRQQQQINTKTKDEQKSELRDLLLD